MLSNAFFFVAGLVGLVAASPYPPRCEPQTICIDAINTCGIRYGDCYDVCSPELSPTAPPCPDPTSVEYPEITAD